MHTVNHLHVYLETNLSQVHHQIYINFTLVFLAVLQGLALFYKINRVYCDHRYLFGKEILLFLPQVSVRYTDMIHKK